MNATTFRAVLKALWAALGASAITISLLILAGCLLLINAKVEFAGIVQYNVLGVMLVQLVGAATAGYGASVHDPDKWVVSAAIAAVAFQILTQLLFILAFGMYTRVPGPSLLSTLLSFGISAALGIATAWTGNFWRRRQQRALA